ncbi:ferritin-like domain-containing protein [Novosphingobium sp. M1R2S20]|uniref:Ferritin-like domain-containing protein n=1 Tax=Novosphingobium rhizovicinum TaxID=3228928 RepID=A0ABV3R9M1_9SPHN
MSSVSTAIREVLLTNEPRAKVMGARRVAREWKLGRLSCRNDVAMPDLPGRPERPELLPPNRMPKRGKAQSERGRVALWHALAHIEFVAIDLALDMAGRFGKDMGEEFVGDFLHIAAEEALHFTMIDRHLRSMGSYYGALAAHSGLWHAAHETRHDVAARLAIVPMVLEARGLDVTPPTLTRVQDSGDDRGARILQRILDDEIRHVGTGVKHFIACAERTRQAPSALWKILVLRHFRGSLKPPFNDSARRTAGLSREWYLGVVAATPSVLKPNS